MEMIMNRIFILSLILFFTPSFAAEPNDLQELLEQVKEERTQEKVALAQREQKFKKARDKQKKLLDTAIKTLEADEKRSTTLRKNYDSYTCNIRVSMKISNIRKNT